MVATLTALEALAYFYQWVVMFPSGYDSFLQYGAVNTVLISYTYQWIINNICQTSILFFVPEQPCFTSAIVLYFTLN